MDQRLIAIIATVGFRFVLLAIPALDNFWRWTMRRFSGWCPSCSEGSVSDDDDLDNDNGGNNKEEHEQSGPQIIELHPVPAWGTPIHQLSAGNHSSSGIVILLILYILQLLFTNVLLLICMVNMFYFLFGKLCPEKISEWILLLKKMLLFLGRPLSFPNV